MKSFIVFLNFVVFILFLMLVFIHVIHLPPEEDKILKETPASATNTVSGRFDREIPFSLPPVGELVKTNLFRPDRGKEPEQVPVPPTPPVKKDELELLATFKVGERTGAMISMKADTRPKNPQQPQNQPQNQPDAANEIQAKTKKLFYSGDKLPNGCILKDIKGKQATLEQDGNEFTLEIDSLDKGSKERLKNAPQVKPAQVITESKPAQKQPVQDPKVLVHGKDVIQQPSPPPPPPVPGKITPPVASSPASAAPAQPQSTRRNLRRATPVVPPAAK